MNAFRTVSVVSVVGLLLASSAIAQQQIAPTAALTPEAERASFTVPSGFAVQLVAAEPDIQKPMQHCFDAQGRLWVTTSRHYPFAAAAGQGTDRVYILSDFAADGRAKSIKVFADTLNIPIGILPLADGKSCIVSSVGEIVLLKDTDGDGKADVKTTLFEGFGTRDTHGMTNSFTPMPDGWVYACHGFSNDSTVTGRDGHTVKMQSGHTFRFRADGSRIEVFTRGQVNPFGMTTDGAGNLYTADCHSKPITQLIRGAHYDSFGKPHDGLGYAPHVTRHDHGSTGLCGLTYYTGSQFPAMYRGTMFLGNVVTNRVNHDVLSWRGATPVAIEQPDFLSSTDPWFRPIDIKQGPDGALYITDFYNKIIGHYEVDLKHPERDKNHGRIWRVVYTGKATDSPLTAIAPTDSHLRDLCEKSSLSAIQWSWVLAALEGDDVHQSKAALEVLTVHAAARNVPKIAAFLERCPSYDTHRRQAGLIALRNALVVATPEEWAAFASAEIDANWLDRAALGTPNAAAADWFAARFARGVFDAEFTPKAVTHAMRYGTPATRDRLFAAAVSRPNLAEQVRALAACRVGLQAAGQGWRAPAAAVPIISAGLDSTDANLLAQSLELLDGQQPEHVVKVLAILKNKAQPDAARQAALASLERTARVAVLPTCGDLATDASTPADLRQRAGAVFAASVDPAHQRRALELLATAPDRLALSIAQGMATSATGAEALLQTIQVGKASPRLLQEKTLLERLRTVNLPKLAERIATLTANLPPADAKLSQTVRERSALVSRTKPDLAAGAKLYTTHCAACHRLADAGGKVGPQLDGVGNRGVDRLCEDILDPNRNVDAAFRATTLHLADGRVLIGLVLRQEGQTVVIADATGKEMNIGANDIETRAVSNLSPMPADWSEKLTPTEFAQLAGFLLSQKPK